MTTGARGGPSWSEVAAALFLSAHTHACVLPGEQGFRAVGLFVFVSV